MELQGKPGTDLYSLVAGRLIWDPHFVTSLIENPKHALTDTLIKANITPTPELLQPLLATLEGVKESPGYDELLKLATDYLALGPSMVAVV